MIIRWKLILCALGLFLHNEPLLAMQSQPTPFERKLAREAKEAEKREQQQKIQSTSASPSLHQQEEKHPSSTASPRENQEHSTEVDITQTYEFDGEKLSIPVVSKLASEILNSTKEYERRSKRVEMTGIDFLVNIKMPEHREEKRTAGTSGALSYDHQLRNVQDKPTLEKLLKRSTFNTNERQQFVKILEDAISHITNFKVNHNSETGNNTLLIISTLPEVIGKAHNVTEKVKIVEAREKGSNVYMDTNTVAICLGLGKSTSIHDLSEARALSIYPIDPNNHAFKCSVQEVVEEK